MSNITTTEALASLLPNVEFTLVDDSYDSVIWAKEPKVKPTAEQIEAKKIQLNENNQAELTAKLAAKEAVLAKLGLTAEEAALLLA